MCKEDANKEEKEELDEIIYEAPEEAPPEESKREERKRKEKELEPMKDRHGNDVHKMKTKVAANSNLEKKKQV